MGGISMTTEVKSLDKRSGITYIYQSTSYWDKVKKAPRCKRVLIAKLDPVTGERVPTDGRGKRRRQKEHVFCQAFFPLFTVIIPSNRRGEIPFFGETVN